MNEVDNVLGMEYGWLIGLGVLVIILVLVFAAMRSRRGAVPKYKSPLEILKKRYAKGEISKEEFEEKRRQIT